MTINWKDITHQTKLYTRIDINHRKNIVPLNKSPCSRLLPIRITPTITSLFEKKGCNITTVASLLRIIECKSSDTNKSLNTQVGVQSFNYSCFIYLRYYCVYLNQMASERCDSDVVVTSSERQELDLNQLDRYLKMTPNKIKDLSNKEIEEMLTKIRTVCFLPITSTIIRCVYFSVKGTRRHRILV